MRLIIIWLATSCLLSCNSKNCDFEPNIYEGAEEHKTSESLLKTCGNTTWDSIILTVNFQCECKYSANTKLYMSWGGIIQELSLMNEVNEFRYPICESVIDGGVITIYLVDFEKNKTFVWSKKQPYKFSDQISCIELSSKGDLFIK